MKPYPIGERIRQLREAAGLSGNALAKLAGIGQSTLSRIESGVHSPTLDVLEKISDALGITLAELVGEQHPPDMELQRLAKSISRLSPEQREALQRFLDTINEPKNEEKIKRKSL